MVLKFYWHPLSPPATVVRSVLESLQIPHEKIYIDLLEARQQRTPEYLAINPEGKVPYIVDGDFGLGESRAIICYLCAKYENQEKENKLYPTDVYARAEVDKSLYQDFQYFCNILEYFNLVGIIYRGEIGPIASRWPGIMDALEGMERRLKNQKYMAGNEITLADYSAMASIAGPFALLQKETLSEFPLLAKWMKAMESLPMYETCYSDMLTKFKGMYTLLVAKNKAAKEEKQE